MFVTINRSLPKSCFFFNLTISSPSIFPQKETKGEIGEKHTDLMTLGEVTGIGGQFKICFNEVFWCKRHSKPKQNVAVLSHYLLFCLAGRYYSSGQPHLLLDGMEGTWRSLGIRDKTGKNNKVHFPTRGRRVRVYVCARLKESFTLQFYECIYHINTLPDLVKRWSVFARLKTAFIIMHGCVFAPYFSILRIVRILRHFCTSGAGSHSIFKRREEWTIQL